MRNFWLRFWVFGSSFRNGNGGGIFLDRSSLGEVRVAAFLFEELGEVGLAVDESVERGVG
ncbi:hypothetical protein U1Q18_019579 [Sarracenia purpurea var. burkii]